MVEDRLSLAVGEDDIVEVKSLSYPLHFRPVASFGFALLGRIEDFEDPRRGRQALLEGAVALDESLDGTDYPEHHSQEEKEEVRPELSRQNQLAPDRDDDHRSDDPQDFADRTAEGFENLEPDVGPVVGPIALLESTALETGHVEGLQDSNSCDALLQHRRGLSHLLLHPMTPAAQTMADPHHQEHVGRNDYQSGEQELPTHHGREGEGHQDHHSVGDELGQHSDDRPPHHVHVDDHPAHEVAGALLTEEAQGQRDDGAVEGLTDVIDHPMLEANPIDLLQEGEEVLGAEEQEEQHAEAPQHLFSGPSVEQLFHLVLPPLPGAFDRSR